LIKVEESHKSMVSIKNQRCAGCIHLKPYMKHNQYEESTSSTCFIFKYHKNSLLYLILISEICNQKIQCKNMMN